MTTITITGKVKRAIWNLPLTSAKVSVALKAILGSGITVFPAETQNPPYKVDTDGTINGSGGFEVQAPTVASGDTAQYGFAVLLLDEDGETETQTEQTANLNDADTSLALEDALSGGSAGTGGEITVSGLVYHPFGDGVPYATGTVTVALVTQFITDDGLFPAISADIPIKDGYFNGDVDLVLYVPDGQSEWLFTFPDGSSVTAMLGTHTSMVEIADIANGDYASDLDPMNVPTSFSATLDGSDVDLTWNDTNSDETGYRIERSDDGGATWDAVTVTSAGATSYTDIAPADDDYIYRIRAQKSGGQSAWVTDTVSVSSFSPDDIADLALWLDASSAATLFQDSGGTTPVVADNDPVGKWNDKSGNNRHVTQSTSGNRPTRQTSGGYVGVRFDGTNDNLTGTVISAIQDITAFAVIRLSDTNHDGAIFNNGDTGGWGLGIGAGTWESTGNDLIWLWGSIQWRDSAHALGTGRSIVAGIANLSGSDQQTTLRHNGAQVYQAMGLVGATAVTEIAIGGYAVGDRYFDDDILEVLIYTQVLDAGEIDQVETYLADKWGITL